jgi:hypothetical protein
MNITEEMIREYVDTFHKTLSEWSGRFFPPEKAIQLLHNSLIPAKITCYVSTQFGVAVEYSTAAQTTIETLHGSARVEDLFLKIPPKLQNRDTKTVIGYRGVTFGYFKYSSDVFPFRLADEDADLPFSRWFSTRQC